MATQKKSAAKEKATTTPNGTKTKNVAAALGRFPDDAVITVLKKNARRPGTKAAKRYAFYKTGATVGDFIKAGGKRGNVRADLKRGNISIEIPSTK